MHHYQATKLLRSLATIGGVSNRTLEAQLAWIKKHPEAPTRFASTYIHSQPGGHYRGLAVRQRPLHPHALYIRCWKQMLAMSTFLEVCFGHSMS